MNTMSLLDGYSLEMTAKDRPGLSAAAPSIPPGTRVNVTFLPTEDQDARLAACRAVTALGFVPVPHIVARRTASLDDLDATLGALEATRAIRSVFVVGGDPTTPEGPFHEALQLIRSGSLERHGVRNVAISGYPEGHPAIAETNLWTSLESKIAATHEHGLVGSITTQFSFDSDSVLHWIEAVRARGIDEEIRVGVPGPAGVGRLMKYARRFGVASSAGIVKKYGLSLGNLVGTAGPDRFVNGFAEQYNAQRHGEIRLHFYTFGDLVATGSWVQGFRSSEH